MSAPPDIRSQIRSLSIPKDQRPAQSAASEARRRTPIPIRWIVVCVVIAVLVGGGYLLSQQMFGESAATAANASQIRIIKVTRQAGSDLPPVLTATGKIVSDHRVQVSTKVSGQIVELLFEQGDHVKTGQLLAKIEDRIYRARRDEAKAMLEKARASLAYQKVNYERINNLFTSANAPDIEMAEAKRALHEAEAQLIANEASLDFMQKALEDCEVKAPISGVVLERNVEVGDFVSAEGGRGANANAQFGAIADMTALRVEVDISELDIARIKKGQPCVITPDAYKSQRYRGHVMWIDPGANYSKATVQAKVRIDNPDDNLRVEGSAQVAFLGAAAGAEPVGQAGSIWIPKSATVRTPGQAGGKAFQVVDNRFEEMQIEVGRESGDQIEVLKGLSEGMSIAGNHAETIRPGQRTGS
jgi:RND family efflux transporter MFP subunit